MKPHPQGTHGALGTAGGIQGREWGTPQKMGRGASLEEAEGAG